MLIDRISLLKIFVKTLTGKTITLEVSSIFLVTRAFRLKIFTTEFNSLCKPEGMNRTHFFKRPSNTMVRMFDFYAYSSLLKAKGEGGGGGRGARGRGYSTNVYMFIRGGSAPRSNSLHFYKPFFLCKR